MSSISQSPSPDTTALPVRIAELEAALRASEDRTRLLLDSTAEAIYSLDVGGCCTFANAACTRLLGYRSENELLGRPMHELIHHSRRDGSPYPIEECPICRVPRTGQGVHVDDEALWRADRASFFAECWAYPICQNNQEIGLVVTFVDITQRRQADEVLRRQAREMAALYEAAQQKLAQVARTERVQTALFRISEAVHTTQNLDDLYRSIHSIVSDLMPAHNFGIALYDAATDMIHFPYYVDDSYQAGAPSPRRRSNGLIEYVLTTGEPLLGTTDDIVRLAAREHFRPRGRPAQSWLGVPLLWQQRTFGVLVVQTYAEGETLTEEHLQILMFVSAQVVMAIQRKRAEQLQASIYRISEATLATRSLDELYVSIHHIVSGLMPAGNFYIALYEAATGVVSFPYLVDELDIDRAPRQHGHGLTEYVLSLGAPWLGTRAMIQDLVDRGIVENAEPLAIDWVGVPLQVDDQTIGLIAAQSYSEHVRLTEEHKDILRFVSAQVAMAVQRKRAEDALRASEQRYRALFDEAQRQARELALLDRVRTALTHELDLKAIFHTVVTAIAETFGYTLVSLYQLAGDRLILQHQVGYSHVIPEISLAKGVTGRVASTGQPELLADVRTDPAFLGAISDIVSEVCVPLLDQDRVVGVLNIESTQGVGLTEADLRLMVALSEQIGLAISRTRLYTEARENSARLIAAVESLPFDFWVLDADGRYVMQNSISVKHFGVFLGKRPEDVQVDPDIAAQWQAAHRRAFAGEVVNQTLDYVFDGEKHILFEIIAPIWSDGQVRGILGANIDVTERRRTEEALRQAQKMESLGILTGGIAHDFNNLLVAMLGQASLALLKLSTDSAARPHIEKAVNAAQRAATLTRQLLAYSGRAQLDWHSFNLNTLIQENLHLFEVAMPKTVELRSDLTTPLPLVEGDPGQVQQVIMNLILNAAEAIGERPGHVIVKTSAHNLTEAELAAWRIGDEALFPGRFVILEVEDNGSGMSPETLAQIFDPFFTTKFTGRGLGLAAVLGIIRGHQGGLQVKSTLQVGTHFRIAFPAAELETAPLPIAEPVQESAVVQRTVLVIDDEAPVRDAVTDILTMEEISVLAAPDGQAGLAIYRMHEAKIGLVILDLSMPGLSGEEALHELRQINGEVPVLLSSGYSQDEVARRFAGQPAISFIQKPYEIERLIDEVKRRLTQSDARERRGGSHGE